PELVTNKSVEKLDPGSAPHSAADRRSYARAGDRDRTGMTSLEGWDSAIELHPRSRSRYPRGAGNPPPAPARRGGRIRTADRLPPKQVRYRCATPRCAATLPARRAGTIRLGGVPPASPSLG